MSPSKNAVYRHEYVIGDVQGCFASLKKLLKHIDFDAKKDRVFFSGDLVARGEDSLGALRYIKNLSDKGAAQTVLGNHDIHLIAVWRGVSKAKSKDKTAAIFDAKDCDKLLNWLRSQPLLLAPSDHALIAHAGIPHIWSAKQAKALAKEVEAVLGGKLKVLDAFLPDLYGSEPSLWSDGLAGASRLRCIVNYFTRMRMVSDSGRLEFGFKGKPNGSLPPDYKPWYEWHTKRQDKVLFGHWAALEASIDTPKARALDGGCVWGGRLVAYRLKDGKTFFVDRV